MCCTSVFTGKIAMESNFSLKLKLEYIIKKQNEDNFSNKIHSYDFKLFHVIKQITFLLQDNASLVFLNLVLLRELFVFQEMCYILKYKATIFSVLLHITH